MLYSEFCNKEVICAKDCRKLGHVIDLDMDPCKGCILRITVAEKVGFFRFLTCGSEITIPFCDICKVGPDIILVDIK